MSNNLPYTPAELQNKYIVRFKIMSDNGLVWDCVRYSSGPRSGLPYLYNNSAEGKNDLHFDPANDKIVPAVKFFQELNQKEKPVFKP